MTVDFHNQDQLDRPGDQWTRYKLLSEILPHPSVGFLYLHQILSLRACPQQRRGDSPSPTIPEKSASHVHKCDANPRPRYLPLSSTKPPPYAYFVLTHSRRASLPLPSCMSNSGQAPSILVGLLNPGAVHHTNIAVPLHRQGLT